MTNHSHRVALTGAALLAVLGAAAAAAATAPAQAPAQSGTVMALPDSTPNKWTEPEP